MSGIYWLLLILPVFGNLRYILKEYSNCYIILIDFLQTEKADFGLLLMVPVTRFLIPNKNSSSELRIFKTKLQSLRTLFIYRRQICHASVVIDPPSEAKYSGKDLNAFSWLVKCHLTKDDAEIVPYCYGRHTYLLYVTTSVPTTLTLTALGSFLRSLTPSDYFERPILHYVLKKNVTSVFYSVITPCLLHIPLEVLDVIGQLKSHSLRVLNTCPLAWLFDREKYDYPASPPMLFTSRKIPVGYEPTNSYWATQILTEILGYLNQTDLRLVTPNLPAGVDVYFREMVEIESDTYVKGSTTYASHQQYSSGYRFFTTAYASYKFMTCDGVKEFLSFKSFAGKLNIDFWVITALSLTLIAGWLGIVFKAQGLKSTSPFFLLLATIFEHDLILSKKFGEIPGFRYFVASFLVACLTIVNTYRGNLTSGLTAPKPRMRLESVDEALDQEFKVLVNVPYLFRLMNAPPNSLPSKFLNSTPSDPEFKRYIFEVDLESSSSFYSHMYNNVIRRNRTTQSQPQFEKIFNSLEIDIGLNYSYLNELSKCSKTLVIDEDSKLESIYLELQNKITNAKLYVGSETMFLFKKFGQ